MVRPNWKNQGLHDFLMSLLLNEAPDNQLKSSRPPFLKTLLGGRAEGPTQSIANLDKSIRNPGFSWLPILRTCAYVGQSQPISQHRLLSGIQESYKINFEGKFPFSSLRVFKHFIRSAKRPWNPSFSMAIRILLLVRVAGAMYSNISDCDEGK